MSLNMSLNILKLAYKVMKDSNLIKKKIVENSNKNKVLPRFELGLLDSESNVLTITPYVRM